MSLALASDIAMVNSCLQKDYKLVCISYIWLGLSSITTQEEPKFNVKKEIRTNEDDWKYLGHLKIECGSMGRALHVLIETHKRYGNLL
jgi:hypothetical protein